MKPALYVVLGLVACDSPGSSSGGLDPVDAGTHAATDTQLVDTLATDVGVPEVEPEPDPCVRDIPCVVDGDCPDGTRCNDGLERPMCQEITCGTHGTPCDDDVLCAPDLRCIQLDTLGTCGRSEVGEPCAVTDHCVSALTCPERGSQRLFPYDDGERWLFWGPAEGCIALTYSPTVAWVEPHLGAAMAAWIDPGCTPLCLEGPTLRSGSEAGVQNIHFVAGDLTQPPELESSEDGQLFGTVVQIMTEPRLSAAFDVAHALGKGLGFSFGGGPSVMASSPEVTEGDRAGVCEWYPHMVCR